MPGVGSLPGDYLPGHYLVTTWEKRSFEFALLPHVSPLFRKKSALSYYGSSQT